MDIKELFENAPWLNVTQTAKEIGINPALLRRYVCGDIEPSEEQKKRIILGIVGLHAKLRVIMGY